MAVEVNLGPMIKDARENLGMTQTKLGKMLGCSYETVSRFENGKLEMSRKFKIILLGIMLHQMAVGSR